MIGHKLTIPNKYGYFMRFIVTLSFEYLKTHTGQKQYAFGECTSVHHASNGIFKSSSGGLEVFCYLLWHEGLSSPY